jgi:hypothetical protein
LNIIAVIFCLSEYFCNFVFMINLTSIIRPVFLRRFEQQEAWRGCTEIVQRRVLSWLINKARKTQIGDMFDFADIRSYEDYVGKVPVVMYECIKPMIMQMLRGERNVLWHGVCHNFAQSSGTSDGKSKYIPITKDSFRYNHYVGGSDVVARYLGFYPDSRIFDGKSFILGGSFANEIKDLRSNVRVGDLSANLIENINPLVNLVRVPSKKVALMQDWTEKLPALVEASMNENITNISGVPSWFMTIIREIMRQKGVEHITDVWRNLEVFFHGGISFEPYREQYREFTSPKMRFFETYNASEGFFAVQHKPDSKAMMLLLDAGIFYEFLPLDQLDEPYPDHIVPAWRVEQGKTYALVITSCNGLWRYLIGDTVKIESVDPLTITIAGRTHHFINAFGEELMVHNAEAAMAAACSKTGARVFNYTAAPVYAEGGHRGHHQWLIEWAKRPTDTAAFAEVLDKELQQQNSDYQAKRSGGIFLDNLCITDAMPGLFDRWLASTGKLGGQRKVPRLSNDRKIIEAMLKLN